MKIINDYQSYDDYVKKANENFRPKLKKVLDKHNETLKLMVKKRKIAIYFGIAAGIIGFLDFILYLFLFKQIFLKMGLILILVIAAIAIILGIICFYKLLSIKNTIKILSKQITRDFNATETYKEAIQVLDRGMEYLGSVSDNVSNLKISISEIKNFTPDEIIGASTAQIYAIRPTHQLLIDKKYKVCFTNVHWRWKVKTKDEWITQESFTGILKIDTRILAEKAFDFRLLSSPNFFEKFFKKDVIKLENNEFNKVFRPQTGDELKIRKMYTPLAMELSLKRYFDTKGVSVSNVKIESNSKFLYFTYNVDWNFMYLDFPKTVKNPESFLKEIFDDFITDTYSLYYILSLIYITLYLD